MTSLPGVGTDANGQPVVKGVQERQLTQDQANYSDTLKAAELVQGEQGIKLRALLATNPTASAGLVTSLAKAGALPNNPLVDTLAAIDKQTQTQRQLDVKKASNKLSTDRFNKTPQGMIWSGFKSLVRGITVAGSLPLEAVSAPFRTLVDDVGKIKDQATPTRAGIFGTFETLKTAGKALEKAPGQTTAFQVTKNLVDTGKIDLGAGFFPSEEVGAGFAARQEQLKYSKVAFEVGGKTYYRPYSIFDPAAYLLTLGHPESSAARVLTAVGDIGLSVAIDPQLAYSKIKQAQKTARLASEGATGIKAARAAKDASLLQAQLDEAIKRTDASLKAVHKATVIGRADKTDAYLKNYQDMIKIRDEFNNINIDHQGIADFLTGAGGNHIIDAIANEGDWQKIQKLAKGKLTVEEAVNLAKAGTREQVLEAIAPFIADGKVVQGALETGSTTSRALSKITAGLSPRITQSLQGAKASALSRMPFQKKLLDISNRYHAFVPDTGGTLVHVNDKDKLIETVNNVARYAKLDNPVVKDLLDTIALSDDASKAGYTASAKLFDAIFTKYADKFSGAQLDEFKKLTRSFQEERQNINAYWASQHAKGTDINFVVSGGKPMTIHSAHLDSELLNSFVYIPSGQEAMDFISRAKKFGDLRQGTADIMSDITSLWKKSVLVRPAYITRNIAEEQIRVFATGHISFFNHPLAAMAMFLGKEDGPGWQRLLNKFDTVRNDVYGKTFKGATSADELQVETLAADLVDPYVALMSDTISGAAGDGMINKVVRNQGYQKEVYGHPLWWDGFASQMRILRNSDFVQKVIATKPGQEAKTVDYFLNGGGKKTLEHFIASKNPTTQEFLKSKEGLMQYLFTGVNTDGKASSVFARIEELAGGGKSAPIIKKLLQDGKVNFAKGTLEIPNGSKIANNAIQNSKQLAKGRKSLDDANKEFAKQLQSAFDGSGNWDNVLMTVPTVTLKASKAETGRLNELANKFFQTAVKYEKLTTMGPEFRQTYWDAIRNVVGALDKEALASLKESASKSLSPLRNPVTGNNIGNKHPVWGMLEHAKGDGPMTLDEAHQYASAVASKKVADLFYDASKRRLLFHQLRLVAPFAQAWHDTIHAWGALAMENPQQIYKATKALNWLSSSESSALYTMTDARDYYDPNQGFFFKDPTTGERKFFVPLAGAALNLFQGMSAHPRTSGPFALSATPQSFNFALGGGSIMPGFGPGVTLSTAVLDSLNANPLKVLPPSLEEELYRTLFPYGTPDIKNSGIIDAALLSSNWSRVLGSLAGHEASYAAAFGPSMNYLANSGEYNLDNPQDQKRLIKDTNNLAKYFTMWRGIFGALMPIPFSMRPEALAKNKDGNTVLATSLWADFKNLEVAAGSNKNKAYADFLDTYGPEQIFAIIKTTTGFEPTNLPTYNLIKNDPSIPNKYPDVYGMFYPNGELSQVLYKYQQMKGAFSKMSAKEVMQKATQIRYYAALDRLRTRSAAEGWDSSQFKEASQSLSEKFAQRDLTFSLDTGAHNRAIAQLTKAAYDTKLADSDAVTGLRDYLFQRDKAIKASGQKTLKNAASEDQRIWLAGEAKKILQRNPDFQKLYYTYFKSELEG